MKRILFIFISAVFFIFSAGVIQAKEYKLNIIQTPSTETPIKLFNAIAEATNNKVDIEVVPSGRAINSIETKKIDFVFPATIGFDAKKNAQLNYDFSKATISKLVIILYTNKNKPIDVAGLKNGNKKGYVIETTASLSTIFEFDTALTTNIEGSLKKLNYGRIDGFVYTQLSGDEQLRKLPDLKNIKRQLYGITITTCALQKGTSGGDVDQMLIKGLDILRKNGKFGQIMGGDEKAMAVYNDWQP